MATSKRFGAVAALLAMVTGFTACLKTENNTTPSRPVAAFVVINGISSAAKLDFYDNSTKIKDSVSTGFAGYNYQAYGGTHIFDLKRFATSTTVVSTNAATYDSLTYYTLVAFGDSTSPVFYPIKDDFSSASTGKLNIRVWNLSSNIGPVDVYLNTTKVDSNVTFSMARPITTFKALTTVSNANSITVKKAGTETIVATNNGSTTSLSTGGVYTIFLTGDVNTTSGSLAPYVGYIKNYY
ncbi:DUF4397 domain-containing protein [Chitinophaga sp.]|uniref:DUF4397 domain-containing protein n=1 Tax=Chitinophaga sp. TaxID=1869181 RepID=UPI0031D15044